MNSKWSQQRSWVLIIFITNLLEIYRYLLLICKQAHPILLILSNILGKKPNEYNFSIRYKLSKSDYLDDITFVDEKDYNFRGKTTAYRNWKDSSCIFSLYFS